jgi:hypothetical protein
MVVDLTPLSAARAYSISSHGCRKCEEKKAQSQPHLNYVSKPKKTSKNAEEGVSELIMRISFSQFGIH